MNNGGYTALDIGNKAYQALLEEVYTTPKPGLVDPDTCGAHDDMDVAVFERSARALQPYFIHMAAEGCILDGSPEALFLAIRPIGLLAEQAMYHATDGVNTHKGLIFSLGIFCAAAGRCMRESGTISLDSLIALEKQMTNRILLEELERIRQQEATSHGEINIQKYNARGIRGEAIEGYPAVRSLALPVMRKGLAEKRDWNLVKLQTLLVLMSSVEDSNILARHNPEVLSQVHREAKAFLETGGAYSAGAGERLRQMDRDYVKRNISAGGCADLLAVTIFLETLMKKDGL